MTDNDDFTVAGKIAVLKSKLLGPAQDHWSDYTGGDDWDLAKEHLLSLFPEVQSYSSVKSKIANMKRESNEQISSYANRIHKAYNTLQRLHPAGGQQDIQMRLSNQIVLSSCLTYFLRQIENGSKLINHTLTIFMMF